MDRWFGRNNCMRVSIHQWATCTNAELLVFYLNRTSICRIVHFRSITSFCLFWLHVCSFLPLPVRLSFHPFGFPSNCIRAFWFKLKRKECTLNIFQNLRKGLPVLQVVKTLVLNFLFLTISCFYTKILLYYHMFVPIGMIQDCFNAKRLLSSKLNMIMLEFSTLYNHWDPIDNVLASFAKEPSFQERSLISALK